MNRLIIVSASLFVLAGCSEQPEDPDAASAELSVARGSEAFINAMQVEIAEVQPAPLDIHIEVKGITEAFRTATLAAETGGRVVERLVEPGRQVELNQVLIRLDDTQARNGYNEARARVAGQQVELNSAQSALRRGKELIEQNFISDDDLENLEFAVQGAEARLQAAKAAMSTAKKALDDTQIQAPFNANVEQVLVQEGDYVTPGMPIAVLADFNQIRVRAGVNASEAAMLNVGTPVKVSFDTLGRKPVAARIESVGRVATTGAGSYPLEIWLPGGELSDVRADMVASLSLDLSENEDLLSVPNAALFRRSGQAHVFLVTDGKAQLQTVVPGRVSAARTEIRSGLTAGQLVVIDGQFTLRDGATVSIRN